MQTLKKLRADLGLSQIQFAGLLGISGGLLALVETGKRSLPTNARQVVLFLGHLVSLLPAFDPEAFPILDETNQNRLNRKIRDLNKQLSKNNFLLEGYLTKLEKLTKLAALGEEQQTNAIWPDGSIEKDEWNLLQRKNSKKISKINLEIILLKISISGLEAEIKTASEKNN